MARDTEIATRTQEQRPAKYSPGRLRYTSLLWFFILCGCFDPDPRSVRGALEATARAVEANDGEQLYRFIDQRARHALGGIVVARKAAKALIYADYPAQERQPALEALGDGAHAESAAQLFAMRCKARCMDDLRATLGAPVEEKTNGDIVVVHTTRGATVELFHGSDTWYGIVLNTTKWMAERDRASRELKQIEDNAAVYRRRRQLDRKSETTVSPSPPLPMAN